MLGVLFGIAFGADNKVMANIAGSCFLVWAVVCGIYTNIIRPSELLNKAKSDNIEVRREALYTMGNEEWAKATGYSNERTPVDRARRKDQAVKYWIQAAKLGHEDAADKLLMAQMRR